MIVDVLRNDLGRVCRPGTVRVPRLCRLERTTAVQHLVSTVTGRLEPGRDTFDLLAASFPGGSITGAPKIRAMEILEALEPVRRGPYTGAALWIGPDGALGSSILIRTLVADGSRLSLHVGGGITWRSEPGAEWDETVAKASGPLRAIGGREVDGSGGGSVTARVWLDGRLVDAQAPQLRVSDRGFQLGDGIFETARARRGVVIELGGAPGPTARERGRPGADPRARRRDAGGRHRRPAPGSGVRWDRGGRRRDRRRGTPDHDQPRSDRCPRAPATRVGGRDDHDRHPGLAVCAAARRRSCGTASARSRARSGATPARRSPGSSRHPARTTSMPGSKPGGRAPTTPCSSRPRVPSARRRRRMSGWSPAGPSRHLRPMPPSSSARPGRGSSPMPPRSAWNRSRRRSDRTTCGRADEAFLTSSVAGIVPLTSFAGRPIGTGRPGPWSTEVRTAREAWIDAASLVVAR